jgi:hypothetical protein
MNVDSYNNLLPGLLLSWLFLVTLILHLEMLLLHFPDLQPSMLSYMSPHTNQVESWRHSLCLVNPILQVLLYHFSSLCKQHLLQQPPLNPQSSSLNLGTFSPFLYQCSFAGCSSHCCACLILLLGMSLTEAGREGGFINLCLPIIDA